MLFETAHLSSTQKLSSLTLPWPTNWSLLFGTPETERPLVVEIGFGTGTFLQHLARTRPDANIVGLEISNQCLVKAERAITLGRLPNVRVVHTRAETALRHLFEPATVETFYINFPDPWFKRDHAHRRLLQQDTLDALVSRLVVGGRLYLATDILDYAEMSADLLKATPGLTNLLPTAWANHMPNRVVTKYEETARLEGRECYYFAYERNRLPAPDLPVMMEFAMPHVVLTLTIPLETLQDQFQPFEAHEAAKGGTIHIGFRNVFRSHSALLFEVHVGEPTIEQHTALLLTPHPHTPGAFTVQLSTIGHPRPTPGMHVAVGALTEWLQSVDQQARVLHRNLIEVE